MLPTHEHGAPALTARQPAPLTVAVPGLASYRSTTGIGRVWQSLAAAWGAQVRVRAATLQAVPLPIARNQPYAVRVPHDADVLLLPRLTGAQALRNTGATPSIAIVHDIGIIDFPGDRRGVDWLTYHSLRQSFYGIRHATQVIADSHFTARRLVQHLPQLAERVAVVPLGVADSLRSHRQSPEAARAQLCARLGLQLAAPLVLSVGSELPRKNIPLLLQVFQQLKRRYPSAQLLKIGEAGAPRWRKATLRTMAALGLRAGRDVIVLEGIDDATLASAYCAADVFVSTSLYEGFGLPALEAMALGVPVVVTRCGAHPEVVGDAGRVVEPTVAAFSDAIAATLNDPSRAARVAQAQARAEQFTWQRAAAAYLALMQQTADGGGGSQHA